jgi:hypothetical protein
MRLTITFPVCSICGMALQDWKGSLRKWTTKSNEINKIKIFCPDCDKRTDGIEAGEHFFELEQIKIDHVRLNDWIEEQKESGVIFRHNTQEHLTELADLAVQFST